MSYAESLERLKELQKRPGGAVSKGSKGAFDAFDTTHSPRFRKSLSDGNDREADGSPLNLKLRDALAQACEGLQLTVSELQREFGQDGAEGYAQGHHSTPEYLRDFAVAVAGRLGRVPLELQKRPGGAVSKGSKGGSATFDTASGYGFQKSRSIESLAPEPVAKPEAPARSWSMGPEETAGDFQNGAESGVSKGAKAPCPLDGLPLLRDDWQFIDRRTAGRHDRETLLWEYLARWRAAANAEPVDFRRANRGRFAANSWLREATGG